MASHPSYSNSFKEDLYRWHYSTEELLQEPL